MEIYDFDYTPIMCDGRWEPNDSILLTSMGVAAYPDWVAAPLMLSRMCASYLNEGRYDWETLNIVTCWIDDITKNEGFTLYDVPIDLRIPIANFLLDIQEDLSVHRKFLPEKVKALAAELHFPGACKGDFKYLHVVEAVAECYRIQTFAKGNPLSIHLHELGAIFERMSILGVPHRSILDMSDHAALWLVVSMWEYNSQVKSQSSAAFKSWLALYGLHELMSDRIHVQPIVKMLRSGNHQIQLAALNVVRQCGLMARADKGLEHLFKTKFLRHVKFKKNIMTGSENVTTDTPEYLACVLIEAVLQLEEQPYCPHIWQYRYTN